MGRKKVYESEEARRKAQDIRRRLARKTQPLSMRIPLIFTGVDGEGIGHWRKHRYVLLGVGSNQISDSNGLRLNDIFSHLWQCYTEHSTNIYAGYYLGYDFTQWLKQLPRDRAWYLFTKDGIKARSRTKSGNNTVPFPVRWNNWEFDLLGMKRFKLRPYGEKSWLYICDSGSFFQTSFLKAIDPDKWDEPIVSQEEYNILEIGKASRGSNSFDDSMFEYNALENEILARLLSRLDKGFDSMGVRLGRDQWFGPGQAAQKWLTSQKIVPGVKELSETIMDYSYGNVSIGSKIPHHIPLKSILNVGRLTYYGGWFEIFCHGHIRDKTWEYDINSAYPYIASGLPCLLHGRWQYANGSKNTPVPKGNWRIAHAAIKGSNRHIGAMLHRHPDGRIVRPWKTRGYYWQHELDAASKAGLIDEIQYLETWTYDPCNCPKPLHNLVFLYKLRLDMGKDSPTGKSAKLVYNSVYGKFAQSIGTPKFGNALYASMITAGCRTMILEAIATVGADKCVMVATDAVFFICPNDKLPVSDKLGEWSVTKHDNLTLFKPGMYWDDRTRWAISHNQSASFKSRGISASQFQSSISTIDTQFDKWGPYYPSEQDPDRGREGWFPNISFHTGFSMITCQQALQRNKWFLAGAVSDQELTQDSDPITKRHSGWYDPVTKIYWSSPYEGWWEIESTPYDKTFGQGDQPKPEDFGIHPDGWVLDLWKEAING